MINHVVDFDHLAQHASLFKADILFSCLGTTKKAAGSIAAQRKVDFYYQLKVAELAVIFQTTKVTTKFYKYLQIKD